MKPATIRRFELFYLAWVALIIIDFFVQHDAYVGQVSAQGSGSGVMLGSTFVNGLFVVWVLVMLLLWFLVAHKRSVIAKWIIVALTILNVFAVPFRDVLTVPAIIAWLTLLVSVGASYSLFGARARTWFSEEPAGEDASAE
jgi:hypothetical protein